MVGGDTCRCLYVSIMPMLHRLATSTFISQASTSATLRVDIIRTAWLFPQYVSTLHNEGLGLDLVEGVRDQHTWC